MLILKEIYNFENTFCRLLLLVLVLMCSGGGWWYRFCRQQDQLTAYPAIGFSAGTGRASYRPNSLASPSSSTHVAHCRFHHQPSQQFHAHTHHHHRHHIRRFTALPTPQTTSDTSSHANQDQDSIPPQQPAHSPAIASCLHRLWKQRPSCDTTDRPPPPSYSVDLRQVANGSLPLYRCPYYQLYEPPPSYESVVQLTNTSANPTQCRLVHHAIPCSSSSSSSSLLPTMPSTSVQSQLQQPSLIPLMPVVSSSSSFSSSSSSAVSTASLSGSVLSGASSASLSPGNHPTNSASVESHPPVVPLSTVVVAHQLSSSGNSTTTQSVVVVTDF